MSEYIVTARKWRPMVFEEVVGQEHITTTLRNAIGTGRLAHAYLFSGPRGVGKTTTARLLAKAVNCKNPVKQNPDNECESCREITEGRSFDVQEIDGASNRGVEEIRNLRESVRYAPTKGKYKVYIIDEVHMLTKEAFNALLKTLEEPPPHVLFIFATTEINKVPATILSRCQRFDFRRIKTDEIVTKLRAIAQSEKLSVDDNALLLVARKAEGSLRDAQSLFDQVVALCGTTVTSDKIIQALNMVAQEVYFRVTDLIKTGDAKGGLALVDELMTQGHDLREFLSGLGEHFRNLLVAKTTGSTALIEAADVYRQRYEAEAESFTVADLLRLGRLCAGTESALRWASQPRFKLEADIVQMIMMPRAQDIGELLAKIEDLKKKLSDQGIQLPEADQQRHASAQRTAASPAPLTPPVSPPARRPVTPPVRGPISESPAPHPPAQVAPGEISTRWHEFLQEVRSKKISLWHTMESAQLLGAENGVLRLGCADDFQASMVMKNKDVLAEMFQHVFNVRPRLVTEVGTEPQVQSPPPGTLREASPGREEHPVIAAMKRELGAEPL